VRSDPTLPRTRDVRCPECTYNEAVFFTSSTEEGMTLYFSCCSCGHRWRDYV
jgi:DNA-directed RNA polymerase II subunit RPB9